MADREYTKNQQLALDATGNVLVSASAGSGKTTVMIDKIFNIIKSGGDVRRMVVMTFTRASAAEMKNRLLKELYSALRINDDGHIREQIEAFPFTRICTIDSFCNSLIKQYFGIIGADPSASAFTETEANMLLSDCINSVVDAEIEKGNTDFLEFAERYASGRNIDSVKELILKLRNFLVIQPDADDFFTVDGKSAAKRYYLNYVRNRIKILLDTAHKVCVEVFDAGREDKSDAIRSAMDLMKDITACDNLEEAFGKSLYLGGLKKLGENGKKSSIPIAVVDDHDAFVDEYKAFTDMVKTYREAYEKAGDDSGKDAKVLTNVTRSVEEMYAEKKRKENKLDFGDLGRMALKILADKKVRQEVRESYDYIFIDEYQDTNYIQEELIKAIAKEDNVFTVGDVKQAIYHFRSAEPEIFSARKSLYEGTSAGQSILLNDNFRSAEEILSFVNAVCSEVMTEDFCGIDYRKDGTMQKAVDYSGNCGVEFYPVKEPDEEKEEEKGVYSVRKAKVEDEVDLQAQFVAEIVRRNVGIESIYLPKKKASKVLSYGDIAVLTKTNNQCKKVAKELDKAGIPYNIAGSEFDPEGRELLVDFIRLIYENNDVSALNIMMSKMFAFSHAELSSIRKNSPDSTFICAIKCYKGEPKLELKVSKFLDYINKLRIDSAVLKVSELMTKVLADGLEACYIASGGGVAAGIKKFVATVADSDCDNDVGDFIEKFCVSYKGDKPPVTKDGVTLVTIHSSKGLEYPFVIIPYLEHFNRSPSVNNFGTNVKSVPLYVDRELGVSFVDVDEENMQSIDNFYTLVQKLKKQREERQELARLMYVAFTRAQNRLVLIGEEPSKAVTDVEDAKSFGAFISYACYKNPSIGKYKREFYLPDESEEEKDDATIEEADFSDLWYEYPYIAATHAPAKTTVTEMMQKEEFVARAFDYGKESAGNADEGTAYHLVMQKIAFGDNEKEKVQEFVDSLVKNGEIDGEIAKNLDIDKIVTILNSKIIERAKKGKIYREMPFVMPYGVEMDTLVQGVIDLLIEENDGLIVVDYKASNLDKNSLVSRYAGQLNLYAEAAEKILKKPVKEKVLFNLLHSYEVKV